MQKFKAVKGIIFDLDGTLLHSDLDFAWLRQQLGCPHGEDILTHINTLEGEHQRQANQLVKQHEIDDALNAKWIDGAQGFVTKLLASGMPTAIVTRNCREATNIKLTNNNVPIDMVITREDGPAKPDPATLLSIQKQWQMPSSQLAYIGDYLYDVQAAINAGMVSCLFAPQTLPDYAELADIVFADYEELAEML